jgi:hypothetical protein
MLRQRGFEFVQLSSQLVGRGILCASVPYFRIHRRPQGVGAGENRHLRGRLPIMTLLPFMNPEYFLKMSVLLLRSR